MPLPLQPGVWIEVRLEPYPTDGGTTVYRWSHRAMGGPAFIEGRVLSWGRIMRAMSDSAGGYTVSNASVVLNDADGLIRGLLATDAATQWFENREAAIKLLSDAGRAAGLTARPLMRGVLSDLQLEEGRRARVDLIDRIGPYLDIELPQASFQRTYPGGVNGFADMPSDLVGTRIPLIGGEHNDSGALDAAGNSAAKGMIPAIFAGRRMTIDDGVSVPAFLQPPELTADVQGTPGSTTYFYAVTAFSAYGETVLSNVETVTDGPDALSAVNFVELTWPAVDGAIAYAVYGRTLSTPARRLAEVTTNSYNDTGIHAERGPGPPLVNGAQVPGVTGSFFWDFYVVCLGVVEITQLYASDVANSVAPRRVLMPPTTYGVDFLMPDGPSWPHPDPWVEVAGMRLIGFYARGSRSFHHTEGIVTMAVNVCGYEDVGDGSGDSIQQAFPLLQHFLNEHLFKNQGTGYRDGNWGPLQTWDDGAVEMLATSRFAAAQAISAARLGNAEGYLGAIYLRDPITVREFLQRWCQTFDCFIANNHHGQMYPVLIDDLADASAGSLYRERIEIAQLPAPTIDHKSVENHEVFTYDYDPDAGAFRGDAEEIQDDTAIAALRGKVVTRTVEQWYTRDAATARDAMARRLLRVRHAQRLQPVVTNWFGHEDDLGDQFRVTHRDGPGVNGYVGNPFLLIEQVIEPNGNGGLERVTNTGLDLSRLLDTAFPSSAAPGAFTADGEFVAGREFR